MLQGVRTMVNLIGLCAGGEADELLARCQRNHSAEGQNLAFPGIVVLLGRDIDRVLALNRILEPANSPAKTRAQLAQTVRPEEQQNDDQQNQKLWKTHTEHASSLQCADVIKTECSMAAGAVGVNGKQPK